MTFMLRVTLEWGIKAGQASQSSMEYDIMASNHPEITEHQGKEVHVPRITRDDDYKTAERITPDMARELLDATPGYPEREARMRKAKKGDEWEKVQEYAELMRRDAWGYNGMAIIIDKDGQVIDGFKRLVACVEADTSFVTAIGRGFDRNIVHTVDQHRQRQFANVLETQGVKHAGAIEALASTLVRIDNGDYGRFGSQISWKRLDLVFRQNPEMVEALEITRRYRKSPVRGKARSALIFMAIRADKLEKVQEFLAATCDPDLCYPGDPALVLYNQIRNADRLARRHGNVTYAYDEHTTLGNAILAFNDYCDGKTRRTDYEYEKEIALAEGAGMDDNLSMRARLRRSPDNLGLPQMKGYPGLREGRIGESDMHQHFSDAQVEDLEQVAQHSLDEAGVFLAEVTPEVASDWLEHFNEGNRSIQRKHVSMIARDIMNGRWMDNAQAICFAGNPLDPSSSDYIRLLNGQHRLAAVVEADTPIEVRIATNVPASMFKTYDIQSKRSTSSALPLKDEDRSGDARIFEAAAKFQYRHDLGYRETAKSITPSTSEIKDVLEKHPGLMSRENYTTARRTEMLKVATASIWLYVLNKIQNEHEQASSSFLHDLLEGDNLSSDNPMKEDRVPLLGMKANRDNVKRLPRAQMLENILDAWDRYHEWYTGKPTERQLRMNPDYREQLDLIGMDRPQVKTPKKGNGPGNEYDSASDDLNQALDLN